MTEWIAVGVTAVLAGFGAAVGYGKLKACAQRNEEEVKAVKKNYVPRAQCASDMSVVAETMRKMQITCEHQTRTLSQLCNYARHDLTKQGLNLKEINDILENGGS